MMIKIDMENSFDTAYRSFLLIAIKKKCFSRKIIVWIKACPRGPYITPLLNGRRDYFFKPR